MIASPLSLYSTTNPLLTLIIWFDNKTRLFKAQSPDLAGWESQAATPHALHQQLIQALDLQRARLQIAFR
ncbi:hypothetical protein E8K88_00450 [Lampropedia aestuarii]|uniref:Uncharacterized protein n=1 Tax=Lampropedia aestuarii TaxID=2562762 RepID=A0A4S5BZ96_9BURK|nr:hypothetical protein [Lampropedia aestuarii]MDH5856827.1 hypothetical protein [Lampropedia aestuarii]THJ36415.1 hypothetical protein E8K88_00450 [Lampropedia aestuarii]